MCPWIGLRHYRTTFYHDKSIKFTYYPTDGVPLRITPIDTYLNKESSYNYKSYLSLPTTERPNDRTTTG